MEKILNIIFSIILTFILVIALIVAFIISCLCWLIFKIVELLGIEQFTNAQARRSFISEGDGSYG